MNPVQQRPAVRTFALDGLLEGQIPGLPGIADRLRGEVERAKRAGFDLVLEVDLPAFSLLPRSTDPRPWRETATDPRTALTDVLNDILRLVPDGHRATLFSTLRSIIDQGDTTIHSVYAVNPSGEISVESRTTPVRQAPLPVRRMRWWIPVVAAGLVLGLATLVFLNDRQLLTLWPATLPAADEVAVALEDVAPWLTARCLAIGRETLTLRVERTALCLGVLDEWPMHRAELEKLKAWGEIAAIESAFAGRFDIEISDRHGGLSRRIHAVLPPVADSAGGLVIVPFPAYAVPERLALIF